MGKKKEIYGYLFNRIEEIGGQKMQHIGFEPEEGDFGTMLEEFVPNIGDKLKVKVIFEVLEKE